jgi:hypothetical protein
MTSAYGLSAPKVVTVNAPAITAAQFADTDLLTSINTLVSQGAAPAFNGNTVYVAFLPDGVAFSAGSGVNTGCSLYAGVHEHMGVRHDSYAVVQRCEHDTSDGLNQVTATASHEIIESITDPTGRGLGLPPPPPSSQPWTSSVWQTLEHGGRVEVGDLCEESLYVDGAFTFQRMASSDTFSSGGDPCTPATTDPYYNVATDQEWYTIAPGGTVDIPVTGWSTAPMADWLLDWKEATASTQNEFHIQIKSPTTTKVGLSTAPTINNGGQATLHVIAPSTAKSGDWASFRIFSTTDVILTSYDFFPVGVYVP